MSVNLNRAYRAKLAKTSGVPLDQIDYWFQRAYRKLNLVDPTKDISLIARTMKVMFRSNLKQHRGKQGPM